MISNSCQALTPADVKVGNQPLENQNQLRNSPKDNFQLQRRKSYDLFEKLTYLNG
jgi:hypothetical protein